MCGICGLVSVSGTCEPTGARDRVEAMLGGLSHRGRDAVGTVSAPYGALGATRLAIRGLADGHQPMVDAATGVVAVCNGDIDNHVELRRWLAGRGRTVTGATDVAVIPALYLELGEGFVNRLVGAFAIAVWDPRDRCLTLARDRAGERPILFATASDYVVFATELGAMVSRVRMPVTVARDPLRTYLQFGFFPAPHTPFDEVQKVAPGEVVRIDSHGVRRHRYWRWRNVDMPKQAPSADSFDRVFREAVRRQTDVEVEFGVFLSGGVDSSLVSAVVRSLHPARPLKAFTLRFAEESFDEGAFAERVARQFDMDLVPVWVGPEDLRRDLPALIQLTGEPLADPAWLPTAMLARRAAQDIRLALVGEGADELFGGYPTYLGVALAQQFARLPAWCRAAVGRVAATLPPSEKKVTISFLLKRFVQGAGMEGMARHALWVSGLPPALLARLGVQPGSWADLTPTDGPLLDRVQRWDLEFMLGEGLLTKADRASMSAALECRAPFLDAAVMEFAATLPVPERVRGFSTKVFLKRYATRYLPSSIVFRRKRGLSVPLGRWLRGPLHDWAEAALDNPGLESAGVRKDAAMALLTEHCSREADHARAVWTLVVLSQWLDWVDREVSPSGAGGNRDAGEDSHGTGTR